MTTSDKTTIEEPEVILERDINAWVEREITDGDQIPDFWDDCSTSERLACYLASLGYKRP